MKQKPRICSDTLTNWQRIVNLMASISRTPAGLIMKFKPGNSMNVFVTSSSDGNVWKLGDACTLGSGFYCEEVVKSRDHLLVPDALNDPSWDHNPDLKFGMSFYLGFPLLWPDGEVFGTICVLDSKLNEHAIAYKELILQFKQVVVRDLPMLVEIAERKQAQAALMAIQGELEKRVEERTQALEVKTRRLEDVNTALRVLIENRESAKDELETSMLANINELITPYLHSLKKCKSAEEQGQYIALIESSLSDITSGFSAQLLQKYSNLTPTEIQVINLIRQGKKTKEIANCLNSATSTIDFHRNNIRKKIGLTNSRTNLHTHFLSTLL